MSPIICYTCLTDSFDCLSVSLLIRCQSNVCVCVCCAAAAALFLCAWPSRLLFSFLFFDSPILLLLVGISASAFVLSTCIISPLTHAVAGSYSLVQRSECGGVLLYSSVV